VSCGRELAPVLRALRAEFPNATFASETTLEGTFTCSQAVFVECVGVDALTLERMRAVGAAFLRGFAAGWNDHAMNG
jgi:hypothetical protein